MTWRIVLIAVLSAAVFLAYCFAQDQPQAVISHAQNSQATPAPSVKSNGLHVAERIGLYGRWLVVSGEKDGMFSEAQIGQRNGDVITILPSEMNRLVLS